MNSNMIDIIFVVFICFMAIFGYIKGFVTRLYDFVGTLIVIFLSYFLAKPISSIVKIYQYSETDVFSSMIGQVINQILVFILLFIGLMIVKKIIGIFVKPLLKGIMHTFSLTKWVDHVLGGLIGVIEAIVISYLALVFVVIPFLDQGTQMINDTLLAKQVLKIVPDVSQNVMDLTDTLKMTDNNAHSLETLTKALLVAQDMNLINNEQVQTIFNEHIQQQIQNENISLSASQKEQVEKILQETGLAKDQIESILSRINVSD